MPSSLSRLRFLIPLAVFSGTLLLVLLLTFERMREGEQEILRSVTETAQAQMNLLQDILSDNMMRGNRENARQRLTYAALFPHLVTLILTDGDHTVLIANHQEWVDENASGVTSYDRGRAEQATRQQRGSLIVSEHHHLQGYYPITLGIQSGEIRPLHSGTLFVEYDLADRLNLLKREEYNRAARLCALLFMFALGLSFLLHVLITKRIDRLVAAVKEFAGGNLNVRIPVSGMTELDQLGLAFNEMASDLAHIQECLQEQNIQLEEEVAEREATQEELQVQAACLEEEIAERRQTEEKLQIIFDAAQSGIIMVDAAGAITFANSCVSRLYGFDPSDIVGSQYVDHVHPDERDASENLLQRLIGGDIESISTERHYLCRNGGDFYGYLNAKRHLGESGSLIAVIIVITDITELKNSQRERSELQQKFNQSQKMEAIGRLAGGVAHDFNNKLSVIMGYAELLKIKLNNLSDEDSSRLDEILKAANHSSEITRKLLALSRSELITPRKVCLNSIIEDSRKSLGRLIGEDIRLEFKAAEGLWPSLLDPTQVDQIIMNLAVNARDAMPDGGLMQIETRNVYVDESRCLAFPGARPGEYVQLTVSDNGCGMDSDTLVHIFEPFFTTKEVGKGTGLGLATIFGIVSQNKGFINVYSEVGLGTTFNIYFPRLTLENELSLVHDEASQAVPGNGIILLVEDEEPLRKLAAEMLCELGYTVMEAASPLDAIALCEAGDDKQIDLILTDVIMPGMSGKEMSDRILEKHPAIPVLFMSGYTADIIASKGILKESGRFIQKPFNLHKLSVSIREAIGSPANKQVAV